MDRDRWEQIKHIFDKAHALKPEGRASFLSQACGDDAMLRSEVEALLEHDRRAGSFLEGNVPAHIGVATASGGDFTFSQGEVLSERFQIVQLLGRGGMGDVYVAKDLELDRLVALKFLPQELAQNSLALSRLKREARAASALNHPNICTVYDIGEHDGQTFIVMEYLEGQTLKHRLGAGAVHEPPLQLDALLELAIQIADALDAAHSKGIIHRDIKPENIFVTTRGDAKILDFGLAKLTPEGARSARAADGAEGIGEAGERLTQSLDNAQLTLSGIIVGTAAYMSPEQIRGGKVDARTDLFSFGAVLYEMATGMPAFSGDTPATVHDAILQAAPAPARESNPDLSLKLEEIISKALEKDREARYQHAADIRAALKRLKRDADGGRAASAAPAPPTAATQRRSRGPWVAALATVAGVALVVALAGWFWSRGSRPAAPEAVVTAVPLTTYFGRQLNPTFSPDGSQIAFAWQRENESNANIYVKVIGSDPPLRLSTNPANEYSPAWSPDGRWIAFCQDFPEGDKHAVVLTSPVPGPERTLTESYSDVSNGCLYQWYLAWSPDSRWLAMAGAERPHEHFTLFLLSPETGEKRKITSPPEGSWMGDSCPAFSPDGRTLAFARWKTYGDSDLYLLELSPGFEPVVKPRRLPLGLRRAASPAWNVDGKSLVFSAVSGDKTSLWRVDVSSPSKRQRLSALDEEVYFPTLSPHGNRLAYSQEVYNSGIWRMDIATPGGKSKPPERFIPTTRHDYESEFSPDGKRVVFCSDRSGGTEIWTSDAEGGNLVQVTSLHGASIAYLPRWSPDSRRLTFGSDIEGHFEVYVIDARGGRPQRLTFSTYSNNPSWSHDGKWIYFGSPGTGPSSIYKVPAQGGSPVLVRRDVDFWGPRESPDGMFIYGILNLPVYPGATEGTSADWYPIVRVPVGGGEEQTVLRAFDMHYALAADGIYFVSKPDPKSNNYSIEFLNTATRKTQRIASFDKLVSGVTVSPDRHWLLYTQTEGHTNLMLVENFH